jgi:hypothetical protein
MMPISTKYPNFLLRFFKQQSSLVKKNDIDCSTQTLNKLAPFGRLIQQSLVTVALLAQITSE